MSFEAVTLRLAASSSGPVGAHPCQASTTSAAWSYGHDRWKFVADGSGTVRNSNDVTTPRVPAPAPRSAQNRSPSWCSSQRTTRPSARTTSAPIRRSEVTPYFRPRIPSPPPSVRPAIPTEGQVPAGMARPCSCNASYTSPSDAPAPILATAPSTDTDRIGETSISRPPVEDPPAKLCPPLRVACSRPCRRTNARVWTTSCGLRTPDDAQRPDLVEPSVERPARPLVALGVGKFDDAGDRTLERLPIGRRTRHGGSVSRLLQPKRSPGRARRPGSASARPGSSSRRAR